MARKKQVTIPLYVGIARAGSDAPVVRAGTADALLFHGFRPSAPRTGRPRGTPRYGADVSFEVCRPMLIAACGELLSRELDAVAVVPAGGHAAWGACRHRPGAWHVPMRTMVPRSLPAGIWSMRWPHTITVLAGCTSASRTACSPFPGKNRRLPLSGPSRNTLPGSCWKTRREDTAVCPPARHRLRLGGSCP